MSKDNRSCLDRVLPILTSIEALGPEDRERLFVALYEQYEWLPEHLRELHDMLPIPCDPGVKASDSDVLQGRITCER